MGYSEKEWQERVTYRMDLSGYLVHLTKSVEINGIKYSALDILIKILRERTLIGRMMQNNIYQEKSGGEL
jgi:hypothetical protein